MVGGTQPRTWIWARNQGSHRPVLRPALPWTCPPRLRAAPSRAWPSSPGSAVSQPYGWPSAAWTSQGTGLHRGTGAPWLRVQTHARVSASEPIGLGVTQGRAGCALQARSRFNLLCLEI